MRGRVRCKPPRSTPRVAPPCLTTAVAGIVLGAGLAVGLSLSRKFSFEGDARTAQLAGALMGQGGKQSLIPVRAVASPTPTLRSSRDHPRHPPPTHDTHLRPTSALRCERMRRRSGRRRRRLEDDVYTGTLGQCPRDSQVIIEHEATPTSTYDGTTIFSTADMINCFMSLTPGTLRTSTACSRRSSTRTSAPSPHRVVGQDQSNLGGSGSSGGSASGATAVTLPVRLRPSGLAEDVRRQLTQPTEVRASPLLSCPIS